MLKRALFSFVVLIMIIALGACGAGPGTETPAEAAPTEVTPPVPETPAVTVAAEEPDATLAPAADPFAPVADAVLSRVENTELGVASLFRLLGQPIEGGELIVFQFQDSIGEETAFCTGLAIVLLTGDLYTVSDISVACTRERPSEAITAFTPSGPTQFAGEGGEPALVVFGEIYSADVVAIRVFDTEGGNVAAQIQGGGWYATLPAEAAVSEVAAYNAAGDEIFRGPLTSSPPPLAQPAPTATP